MSMVFSKGLAVNSSNGRNLKAQWDFQLAHRQMFDATEGSFRAQGGMVGNAAAVIPQDVYREFDNVTKSIMLADQGDVILNDLMPLARSLDIGKMVHQYRRAADSGAVNTTLSGLEPIPNDQTRYDYDGAVVPVHQSGFYREWRELAGQRSEGFDAMIDDQAGSVRAVRKRMADYILNGDPDVDFKGVRSYGLRNAEGVAKVDLATLNGGFDFTDRTTTGEQNRNAMIALLDTLRIDNNVAQNVTVYISRQIMSNWERYFTDQGAGTQSGTIMAQMAALAGVAAIKSTSVLDGNELIVGVLDSQYIVPLVGQAVSTIMLPRQTPFARHQGIVWSAMGIEIRTDYAGRTGWLYAANGAA